MFVYPIFWGCKYTNNFLFINKKPEFQQFKLLITSMGGPRQAPGLHQHRHKATLSGLQASPAAIARNGRLAYYLPRRLSIRLSLATQLPATVPLPGRPTVGTHLARFPDWRHSKTTKYRIIWHRQSEKQAIFWPTLPEHSFYNTYRDWFIKSFIALLTTSYISWARWGAR